MESESGGGCLPYGRAVETVVSMEKKRKKVRVIVIVCLCGFSWIGSVV